MTMAHPNLFPELDGPSYETAADLITHPAFAEAMALHLTPAPRQSMTSWDLLNSYLLSATHGQGREAFRVLFLDKKNHLIVDELMGQGTVDHAPVYPREIMRRALELDACAIILTHNHPSGDPTPSREDIAMTAKIAEACKVMRITLHDHVITGAGRVVSFRSAGLL